MNSISRCLLSRHYAQGCLIRLRGQDKAASVAALGRIDRRAQPEEPIRC